MEFIADFHVHSKFSRATSKNLDLENLYMAACLKGITVIGTGDFTHPEWFSEIKNKLQPAEPGLFRLKDDIVKGCNEHIPRSCKRDVRFLLVSEISNIYKKNNFTRKNHNLIFVPDLDTAARFNSRLDQIGNIKSDGRPILGLDARNLLEILLETSEQNFLIPAHIWTPWFSLLGSKSGFDSIEECFEDLTPHIFAVETGLSSDPQMNWRVSDLDGLTLISNSDAHSPMNLGREANLFHTTLSYSAIKSAMETGNSETFLGTIEFYPEEGKYHLDGHRKCQTRLWPKETLKHNGICPVCGKPLTLGVLYRVEELADRSEGEHPEKTHPFYSTIPLTHILSEILKVGAGSKKVAGTYRSLLEKLGPEFDILQKLDTGAIDAAGTPLLGEAVRRMRQKKITVFPGFDGEFGKIKIFEDDERKALIGQKTLFAVKIPAPKQKPEKIRSDRRKKISDPCPNRQKNKKERFTDSSPYPDPGALEKKTVRTPGQNASLTGTLNEAQQRAVAHSGGPMLIVAGPGTGKTRTITHRIAHLINTKGIAPEHILAVTFTNKAAKEMETRLKVLVENPCDLPLVVTFHSLCLKLLSDGSGDGGFSGIIDEADQKRLIADAKKQVESKGVHLSLTPGDLASRIAAGKQQNLFPSDDLTTIVAPPDTDGFSMLYQAYQRFLSIQRLLDFEDLILRVNHRFKTDNEFCEICRQRFRFVFVDEYQDVNRGQYELIKHLVPSDDPAGNICVIGDPNQSIYGFRGSDKRYFERFTEDYPKAEAIRLTRNYRSTETILSASSQVIQKNTAVDEDCRTFSGISGIDTLTIIETATEKSEAVAVGKIIERLLGGTGFHSIDFESVDAQDADGSLGFSDFAVLYRTSNQGRMVSRVFENAGIPYQIVNKSHIFDKQGARELMSLLRFFHGCATYGDLERVVPLFGSGVGKKTLETLKTLGYTKAFTVDELIAHTTRFPVAGIAVTAQRRLSELFSTINKIKNRRRPRPVTETLLELMRLPEISKPLAAIEEDGLRQMLNIAASAGSSVQRFLQLVCLRTDTDIYDPATEKVALMTLHAAKGLEFPVVFIVGCENGLIPFENSRLKTDPEEERRLFYVAMTRARSHLYITCAKKRRISGRLTRRTPSVFIEDIERRLRRHSSAKMPSQKKECQVQLDLF